MTCNVNILVMKKSSVVLAKTRYMIVLAAIVLFGCDSNDSLELLIYKKDNLQTKAAAEKNTQLLELSQSVLDITAEGMLSEKIMDRQAASISCRGSKYTSRCHPLTISHYNVRRMAGDTIMYEGSVITDFGSGNSCVSGEDLKMGKIINKFTLFGNSTNGTIYRSTETITFNRFQIDSVGITGSFVTRYVNGQSSLEASNVEIIDKDQSSIKWNGLFDYDYLQVSADRKNDSWAVTGSAAGATSAGDIFNAAITKKILYNTSCYSESIPVSGLVEITMGKASSIIDYGTNTCDKIYSIQSGDDTVLHSF